MLYVFDLDSTLVERYKERVLPGVADVLASLSARGDLLAVATNQAGPAWRLATGRRKYPDPALLGARFARISEALPPLASSPWFVAIGDGRLTLPDGGYQQIGAAIRLGGGSLDLRASSDLSWRKPEPGMLLAAHESFGASLAEITYVGDLETDAAAAANAGVGFVFADPFFTGGRR